MELYDLLRKPTSELSQEELDFIKRTISLEEFNQIKAFENELDNIRPENDFSIPSKYIKDDLLSKFESHKKSDSMLKFYNFPLELWKVASVFAIFFLGYNFLNKLTIPAYSVAEKSIKDTVFIVKDITQIDTIFLPSIITKTIAVKTQKTGEVQKTLSVQTIDSKVSSYNINEFKTFDLNDLRENYNHSTIYFNEDSLVDKIGFIQI
jgi:hypothetical protein